MKQIISLVTLFLLPGVFFNIAAGQSDDTSEFKKQEVGIHFTYLRRTDADPSSIVFASHFPGAAERLDPDAVSEFGLGVRYTFNFTKSFAMEVEGNLFPEDKKANPILGVPMRILEPGGRKMQLLAGPKAGFRGKKFGVFGKARLGLIRIDRYDAVVLVGPPDDGFFVLSEQRNGVGFLNADIGGVFEYYPSKRTVIRVDVGDSIIHYRKLPPKELNPSITNHNLQTSIGFGFRF